MVTDEVYASPQTAYAALQAEQGDLQQQVASLSEQPARAAQRIHELGMKKTPPVGQCADRAALSDDRVRWIASLPLPPVEVTEH